MAGVAMPDLRRAADSLAAAYRGDPADLQAEILTEFLAAVRAAIRMWQGLEIRI